MHNPLIKAPLTIWRTIREKYETNDKMQIIQWCVHDLGFKPNKMDCRLKSGITKGVRALFSLTEKVQFKDFKYTSR